MIIFMICNLIQIDNYSIMNLPEALIYLLIVNKVVVFTDFKEI